MKKLIIIFLITLTFSYNAFSDYEKGYEAFIQQNYTLAIKYFNELIEKQNESPETWYYLGVCYLKLNKFTLAKKAFTKAYELDNNIGFVDQDKFITNLRKAENGSKAVDIIRKSKTTSIFYWIAIAIIAIIAFIIVIRIKKSSRSMSYKENKINDELLSNLYQLNSEFKNAQKTIPKDEKKEIKNYLEEVEERCILLNDKIAMFKYGAMDIEEEIINKEINYTKELLKKYIDEFSLVEKV